MNENNEKLTNDELDKETIVPSRPFENIVNAVIAGFVAGAASVLALLKIIDKD